MDKVHSQNVMLFQVQHILASTSPSGRSVVWDLRKNEPIITVSDTTSMVRYLWGCFLWVVAYIKLQTMYTCSQNRGLLATC